ncbi:MAG: hypothetical protein IAF38_04820 [Bacteroidia bacterium]|nr:hypothetical protein [Bacteroidia bacterium]
MTNKKNAVFLFFLFCTLSFPFLAQEKFNEQDALKKISESKADSSKIDLLIKLSAKIKESNAEKGVE